MALLPGADQVPGDAWLSQLEDDNLIPYLALGFAPQRTSPSRAMCGLYALAQSLQATRNLVETVSNDPSAPLEDRHITFDDLNRIMQDGDLEYSKAVFRQLRTTRDAPTSGQAPADAHLVYDNRNLDADALKALKQQGDQFYGNFVNEGTLTTLLGMVNKRLGTYYRLGVVTMATQATVTTAAQPARARVHGSGDAMEAWPVIWIQHDGVAHWSSMGPKEGAFGGVQQHHQHKADSWQLKPVVDRAIHDGLYLLMEDSRGPDGRVAAYRGQFVYAVRRLSSDPSRIHVRTTSVRQTHLDGLGPTHYDLHIPLALMHKVGAGGIRGLELPRCPTIPAPDVARAFRRPVMEGKELAVNALNATVSGVPLIMQRVLQPGSITTGGQILNAGEHIRRTDYGDQSWYRQKREGFVQISDARVLGPVLPSPFDIRGSVARLVDKNHDRQLRHSDTVSFARIKPGTTVLSRNALSPLRVEECVGSRLFRMVDIDGHRLVLPSTALDFTVTSFWDIRKPIFDMIVGRRNGANLTRIAAFDVRSRDLMTGPTGTATNLRPPGQSLMAGRPRSPTATAPSSPIPGPLVVPGSMRGSSTILGPAPPSPAPPVLRTTSILVQGSTQRPRRSSTSRRTVRFDSTSGSAVAPPPASATQSPQRRVAARDTTARPARPSRSAGIEIDNPPASSSTSARTSTPASGAGADTSMNLTGASPSNVATSAPAPRSALSATLPATQSSGTMQQPRTPTRSSGRIAAQVPTPGYTPEPVPGPAEGLAPVQTTSSPSLQGNRPRRRNSSTQRPRTPGASLPRETRARYGWIIATEAITNAEAAEAAILVNPQRRFSNLDIWLLEDDPNFFRAIMRHLKFDMTHIDNYDRHSSAGPMYGPRTTTLKLLRPFFTRPMPEPWLGPLDFLRWDCDWREQVEYLNGYDTAGLETLTAHICLTPPTDRDTMIRYLMAYRIFAANDWDKVDEEGKYVRWYNWAVAAVPQSGAAQKFAANTLARLIAEDSIGGPSARPHEALLSSTSAGRKRNRADEAALGQINARDDWKRRNLKRT